MPNQCWKFHQQGSQRSKYF